MEIKARFAVNGSPVFLAESTGLLPMAMRNRIALLKSRTDQQGNVHQQKNLNGDRLNLPELLEASAPTLGALLDAVEADELRLRGPLIRNTGRVIRRTGEDGIPYYTNEGATV